MIAGNGFWRPSGGSGSIVTGDNFNVGFLITANDSNSGGTNIARGPGGATTKLVLDVSAKETSFPASSAIPIVFDRNGCNQDITFQFAVSIPGFVRETPNDTANTYLNKTYILAANQSIVGAIFELNAFPPVGQYIITVTANCGTQIATDFFTLNVYSDTSGGTYGSGGGKPLGISVLIDALA